MLLIDISRPLLLATLAFSGVAQAWQKSGNSLEGRFVPNKYIVQVNGDAKGLSKRGLTPAKVSDYAARVRIRALPRDFVC